MKFAPFRDGDIPRDLAANRYRHGLDVPNHASLFGHSQRACCDDIPAHFSLENHGLGKGEAPSNFDITGKEIGLGGGGGRWSHGRFYARLIKRVSRQIVHHAFNATIPMLVADGLCPYQPEIRRSGVPLRKQRVPNGDQDPLQMRDVHRFGEMK